MVVFIPCALHACASMDTGVKGRSSRSWIRRNSTGSTAAARTGGAWTLSCSMEAQQGVLWQELGWAEVERGVAAGCMQHSCVLQGMQGAASHVEVSGEHTQGCTRMGVHMGSAQPQPQCSGAVGQAHPQPYCSFCMGWARRIARSAAVVMGSHGGTLGSCG